MADLGWEKIWTTYAEPERRCGEEHNILADRHPVYRGLPAPPQGVVTGHPLIIEP